MAKRQRQDRDQGTKAVIPVQFEGRIAPSVPNIEREVLGAMLIDRQSVPKAIEILTADTFYKPAHRVIFEAMTSLFKINEAIDAVTVHQELLKQGKAEESGGVAYLAELSENITAPAHIEYHAKIILERAILRKIIESSYQVVAKAFDSTDNAFAILDYAEKVIFDISANHLRKSYTDMNRAVREVLDHLEDLQRPESKRYSVPTGYYDLDNLLGGLQKTDLIILAARPAMGKTALALSICRNAALMHNVPVAFFSLEMSTMQLVLRLMCAEERINAHQVRTGKLPASEGAKIGLAAAKLSKVPIYIDDTPSQTILEIRAKSRRLQTEKNIGLVIVDYLQLMQGPAESESRQVEISHISRSLKALAKELNIPVLALAQMNRSIEERKEKVPQLSDLRESGSLEQDADVVMFINRPEVYGMKTDTDGNSLEGIAEVIIAKHRNGPTDTIKLHFAKDYARFENLERFRTAPEQIEDVY